MALVGAGFPVLLFSQNDETRAGIEALARGSRRARRRRLLAGDAGAGRASRCRRSARIRSSSRCCWCRASIAWRMRSRLRAASIRTGRRTSARSPRPSDDATALINGRVLRDAGVVEGAPCCSRGDRISRSCCATTRAVARPTRHDLQRQLLLPGFIDTQVNGGGGVLFNDEPSVEAIRAIGARASPLRHHGLPADADQRRPRCRGARASQRCRRRSTQRVPGVLGIHIEGPFLNVERKGVHDPAKLRELDESARRPAHLAEDAARRSSRSRRR